MSVYFDEGKYRVRIENQAISEGKKREDGTESNPSIELQIMPIGKYEQNELESVYAQYGRTIFLPLSEGTIGTAENPGWVLLTLRYLGWKGESFAELDPSNSPCHSFVGVECDAICQHDEYQGKQKEKWSIFRPRQQGEGYGKPIDKKGLKTLDAKFQKALRATTKFAQDISKLPKVEPKKKEKVPAQPQGDAWEGHDPDPNSDIPF
jgi:hypothetical protein